MIGNSSINVAAALLKSKCNVIPEKFTMYNGGYLFLAYPPNSKDKEHMLSPYYLVDLKTKTAGPFSPAFDFQGFFEATKHLKPINL